VTDVLTVGEALVSFRTDAIAPGWSASAHVAGAESNVAIGLARLGHATRWVGRVSDDALGEWVVGTLLHEGVEIDWVVRDTRPAGVLVLESPADHARRVVYVRRGSAGSALCAADVLPALEGCRRVHLTGVTLALSDTAREACVELARAASDRALPVSLDVNYRAALWSPEAARAALTQVLPFVSTLIASEDELPLVAAGREQDVVARLLAGGVSEVVVKRGERGASAYTADAAVDLAATPVDVVDVIGAGDALSAGFLSGLIEGLDLEPALQRGIEVAAHCVASPGDWEGLPRRPRATGVAG
jgi:2-dehydro-3-deoxygluconokinase